MSGSSYCQTEVHSTATKTRSGLLSGGLRALTDASRLADVGFDAHVWLVNEYFLFWIPPLW